MIYRGDKKVIGIYRGEQGVTAVCQGEELKWQSGPVFDNVVTGVSAPNATVIIMLGSPYGDLPFETTSDENGNFEVQVDMEDITNLNRIDYFRNIKKLNLNRVDTSKVLSLDSIIMSSEIEELDMSMCDLSSVTEWDLRLYFNENLKSVKMKNFGCSEIIDCTIWLNEWYNINTNLGPIWYDIIVTNGFNRKAAGYENGDLLLAYVRNYEAETGFTDAMILDIKNMGYNVTLDKD